eukprot:5525747-Amphidinium_carterae.1
MFELCQPHKAIYLPHPAAVLGFVSDLLPNSIDCLSASHEGQLALMDAELHPYHEWGKDQLPPDDGSGGLSTLL